MKPSTHAYSNVDEELSRHRAQSNKKRNYDLLEEIIITTKGNTLFYY